MADVTPRFLYNNYVPAAATIKSAHTINGTANSGNPTTFLRDQLPSKAWRSPLGWNVVAGFNDKIDYTGGVLGGTHVATIAPGNYPTGALYAAAVQAALVAQDSLQLWTATYSTSTFKFTLAGGIAFVLKWATGTNTATGAHKDLGFAVTDTASVTTATGATVAYHSREFLIFDFGSARAITAVAVAGHNAATGAMTLNGNAVDLWTAPSVTLALTSSTISIAYQSSQTFRYWRLVIDDVTNPDAYTKVGVVFIGDYFQPLTGYDYGFTINRVEHSTIAYADQGANYADTKQSARMYALTLANLSLADSLSIDILRLAIRIGKDFVLALDPQNDPTNTIYGFLDNPITLTNVMAYPNTLWTATISLTEALG